MTLMTRRDLVRAAMATAIGGAGIRSAIYPALAQGTNPIRIGFTMALSGGLAGNGRAPLLS